MDRVLEKLIEPFQQEGAKRHAHWNAELFTAACAGPVLRLWQSLQKETRENTLRDTVLEGYLQLIEEAVGRGYLHRMDKGPWVSLMELVLVQYVPEQLTSFKPARRLEELAKIWNLLEGLLGEPAWVNQLVLARRLELKQLSKLESFLIETLDPVLSPAPTAAFSGPFRQRVLDARLVDEEFLPGEMMLAAPWVLCIQDRRRPVRLGVLLQKDGKSELIGTLPEMEAYQDSAKLPEIAAANNSLTIGKHTVDVPRLNAPYRVAIARAGFVVASAVDSQRLWVLESA